jgi:flagellar capping protein FliD
MGFNTGVARNNDSNMNIISSSRASFVSQIIVVIFSIIFTATAFYFTTKSDISNLYIISKSNTKNIEELTKSVSYLTTRNELLSTQPTVFQSQIADMNERINRIENKQDQIYQILLDMKNK